MGVHVCVGVGRCEWGCMCVGRCEWGCMYVWVWGGMSGGVCVGVGFEV